MSIKSIPPSQHPKSEDTLEWEAKINQNSCITEFTLMNDCYYAKKDWRQCQKEVKDFGICEKLGKENRKKAESEKKKVMPLNLL